MTRYEEVFQRFLREVSEYDYITINEDFTYENLLGLMESSIFDFEDICIKNLSDRDNETRQFNVTLSGKEIGIITTGMLFYWLSPKMANSELLRNQLNTRDYTTFSPSKLIEQVHSLFNSAETRFFSKMYLYSFKQNDVENMK